MTHPPQVLSAINTPFVTGSVGAAATACFPALEQACVSGQIAFPTLKLVNLAFYSLSLYAASRRGRLDGQQTQGDDVDDEVTEIMSLRHGGSLLTPSGWAFAIWAPIFAGECVSILVSLMAVRQGTAAAAVWQQASAGFIVAQIFQTLWAATFRPKYVGRSSGNLATWMSAGMLTGVATSLSRAHLAYAAKRSLHVAVGTGNYLLYFLPLSLHFGWTTAAALVNWNGNLALTVDSPQVLAGAGWASVVAATAVGVAVTLSRSAPVYGAVIAWALAACASGMNVRLEERERLVQNAKSEWFQKKKAFAYEIQKRKGFYGAAVQKWLCTSGAVICGAVSVWTAAQLRSDVTS